MKRRAKRPDRREEALSFLSWTLQSAGDAIARNPLAVGGCTAFLVTLSYVSANALWYQPHFNSSAFFSTRHEMNWHSRSALPDRARRPSAPPVGRQPVALARPAPLSQPATAQAAQSQPGRNQPALQQNASVLAVQAALTELKYYNGPIDGMPGPQTRKAIADFQKASGLAASGNVDSALLDKLKLSGPQPVVTASSSPATPVSAPPQPRPRPVIDASVTQSVPAAAQDSVKTRNIRIQAGLKAFGNEDMKLDGVIGPRTKAAIREFQSLSGLPVTGEPDDRLLAKMRAAGLTR